MAKIVSLIQSSPQNGGFHRQLSPSRGELTSDTRSPAPTTHEAESAPASRARATTPPPFPHLRHSLRRQPPRPPPSNPTSSSSSSHIPRRAPSYTSTYTHCHAPFLIPPSPHLSSINRLSLTSLELPHIFARPPPLPPPQNVVLRSSSASGPRAQEAHQDGPRPARLRVGQGRQPQTCRRSGRQGCRFGVQTRRPARVLQLALRHQLLSRVCRGAPPFA